MMKLRLVKQIIDWSFFAVTILYVLSGLGITQYRTVETLTFGLLTKSNSFNLHEGLLRPFLTLLGIHLIFGPLTQIYSRLKKKA